MLKIIISRWEINSNSGFEKEFQEEFDFNRALKAKERYEELKEHDAKCCGYTDTSIKIVDKLEEK